MKVVTIEEMKDIEKVSKLEFGFDERLIIENVGMKGADFIQGHLLESDITPEIVVMAGKGHNAADGVAISRHLASRGHKPIIFLTFPETEYKTELKEQLKMARAYGVRTLEVETVDVLEEYFGQSSRPILVIDALYGTGVQLPLSNFMYDIIEFINENAGLVVAVDIPSGIDGNHGLMQGNAINADYTLAVGLPKIGSYLADGARNIGQIFVLEVGFASHLLGSGDKFLLEYQDLGQFTKPRNKFADKNAFGHALLLGGSHGLTGALVMAGSATLKVGTGLVTVATWENQYEEMMTRLQPEIMTGFVPLDLAMWPNLLKGLNQYSAIVIGPGLARSTRARRLVIEVLNNFDGPVVLDADAINVMNLKEDAHVFSMRNAPTIMTPHFGEFARFAGVPLKDVEERPLAHLRSVIESINCAVILKGPCTFLGFPDGKTYINFSPNAGLAKGGVGDVLAGMMGGLLGQEKKLKNKALNLALRYEIMGQVAMMAVATHTKAGQLAVKEFGVRAMTATSLFSVLPQVFDEIDGHILPEHLDD